MEKTASAYNVLIIGGSRFSGNYLWKELHNRNHQVTVYNRGKTPVPRCVRESDEEYQKRMDATTFVKGDRKVKEDIANGFPSIEQFDFIFDMNAREASDVEPWVEHFAKSEQLQQYVFMSSAGVYQKSQELPHLESDPVDPQSRHKGKLDCEQLLDQTVKSWCSFRPTYICGPGNYNPLERYFLERADSDRPICIPGHGEHLTGLGHVQDLAVAMANVLDAGVGITHGKVYNVQNEQAITFNGVAAIAAKVMNKKAEIVHYNPKDFTFPEGKKAFPMRPQHFFTNVRQAMEDLNWKPEYNTVESIMKDAYENDFVHVKAAGGLKNDFVCDDMILEKAMATK